MVITRVAIPPVMIIITKTYVPARQIPMGIGIPPKIGIGADISPIIVAPVIRVGIPKIIVAVPKIGIVVEDIDIPGTSRIVGSTVLIVSIGRVLGSGFKIGGLGIHPRTGKLGVASWQDKNDYQQQGDNHQR
jgi:hypothetical protein